MENSIAVSKAKVIWSEHVVSWITLIFGIESGLVVASINWARMGYKAKAVIHFLIAILVACINIFIPRADLELSTIKVLGYCVLAFVAIAYLYTVTRQDIENFGEITKSLNWLPAVLIGIVFALALFSAKVSVFSYRETAFQNHVYCEVLKAGMSPQEVDAALNSIGKHTQVDISNQIVFNIESKPTYYRLIFFEDDKIYLKMGLGYDANEELLWVTRGEIPPRQAVQCP